MLKTTAPKLPITVSFTAINPNPFNKYLCPGKTPKTVASFGAPKNIDGIQSRKVCVTDIAIINTARTIGSKNCKSLGEIDNKITATRFMCIPGIKPVKIPHKIPAVIAKSV